MAVNNIVPFAQGGSANVPTQAAYVADAQRPLGNQPGVARADFNNKALLQASSIAVGIAQYLADLQGTDITDQLSASALSALMNLAVRTTGGTRVINAATSLTAADAGQIQVCGATSPMTITLPLLSAVKDGTIFRFVNTNGFALTITRSGTDSMINGNIVVAPSIVLQGGDSVYLVACLGTSNWYVIGGSAALRFAGDFGATKAANGFQRLPSGLIIQWGASTSNTTGVAVTYPIAFPTGAFLVTATPQATTAPTSVGVSALTTTGFTLVAAAGTPQVNWIAIGN